MARSIGTTTPDAQGKSVVYFITIVLSSFQNIFQTLAYPSFPALRTAEQNLDAILTGPSPPEPSPSIQKVFDPSIARRLVSFVPTRVVELPAQAQGWQAMAMWLDRWQELRRLIGAEDLWSVKVRIIGYGPTSEG